MFKYKRQVSLFYPINKAIIKNYSVTEESLQ